MNLSAPGVSNSAPYLGMVGKMHYIFNLTTVVV